MWFIRVSDFFTKWFPSKLSLTAIALMNRFNGRVVTDSDFL
jgi:hypothetical protein